MTESILNIELHPAYFAYALKAQHDNSYAQVQIEHVNIHPTQNIDLQQLSTWLKGLQNIWNQSFQKIFIAIHGYPTTITPDAESGIVTHQNLHANLIEYPQYIQNQLADEFYFTMSIPKELKTLLDSYFWGATIRPSNFGICKYYLEETKSVGLLNLHITPNEGCFFSTKNNKVRYYNSFKYKNQDDLLYYVLLVYKMLDLSVDSYPLTLTGLVEKDSEIFKLLYQYIRNIHIEEFTLPLESSIELPTVVKPNYLANLLFISK